MVQTSSRLELLSISSVNVFISVGMLCKIELISVIQQDGEKGYNTYCNTIDWRDSISVTRVKMHKHLHGEKEHRERETEREPCALLGTQF